MSNIEDIFSEVIDLREELQSIEEMLEEEHPHEMERMRQIHKEIPAKLEKLKSAARDRGSNLSYLGYDLKVQKKQKTEVDMADLLERARERGDVESLLEIGLIEYTVNPQQLDRMPGDMKAVYGSFIRKVDGTPAVTLPKELKV